MKVIDIINTAIYLAPCILILVFSFYDRLNAHFPKKLVVSVASFLITVPFLYRVYAAFEPSSSILLTLSAITSLTVGAAIFSIATRYNFWQSMFTILIAKSFSDCIHLLSSYIYFLYSKQLLAISSYKMTFPTVLLTIIFFPALWLLFKRLLRPALDCPTSRRTWRLLWMLPFFYTLMYHLSISPDLTNYTQHPQNSFYVTPPLWIFLVFSTSWIIPRILLVGHESASLQESLHLSEVQIAAQKKQTELFQQRLEDTSRSRHDMRHHLMALNGFVATEDLAGLKEYLQTFSKPILSQEDLIYTDNVAINALLTYYKESAERLSIEFTLDISHKEHIPFPDADLCIILGNLLENAMEACQRMKSSPRFIKTRIFMPSHSSLAIIVENSFEGVIRQTGDEFYSSKEKGRIGLGISSILNITEKYNGIPKLEYSLNTFKFSLLLNAPDTEVDKDS